jgi:hypothetical protein
MIAVMRGRPTSRRVTNRLKESAAPTLTVAAKAAAPIAPRRSAESPVATRPVPSIAHSPSAKLIMPEAL